MPSRAWRGHLPVVVPAVTPALAPALPTREYQGGLFDDGFYDDDWYVDYYDEDFDSYDEGFDDERSTASLGGDDQGYEANQLR